MSGNSNSSSEDVGGVVMLALLGAFLWWFFSSSMEDITEDFLEASFEGDAGEVYDSSFFCFSPLGALIHGTPHEGRITPFFAFLFMEPTDMAKQQARMGGNFAKEHDGLDSVEVVASGEIEDANLNYQLDLVNAFSDSDEIDAAGVTVSKVTFNDGKTCYVVTALVDIDTDLFVDGWRGVSFELYNSTEEAKHSHRQLAVWARESLGADIFDDL